MFEAKLRDSHVLQRIIDAIKDLVNEVNLKITPSGIFLVAMDTSHVALVSLSLNSEGFESYRCDSNMVLGVNIANLSHVMKWADSSSSVTLQADADLDTLKIIFENENGRTVYNLNLI